MTGIKSFVLCLTAVLCCNLPAGCSKNRSTPDASADELRKTTLLLAQAEKDRDSVRLVLKAVRREAEKLKTDLDKAQLTMRGALDRLKPLEDEVVQLKKELAKFKAPEKGGPRTETKPK